MTDPNSPDPSHKRQVRIEAEEARVRAGVVVATHRNPKEARADLMARVDDKAGDVKHEGDIWITASGQSFMVRGNQLLRMNRVQAVAEARAVLDHHIALQRDRVDELLAVIAQLTAQRDAIT